MIAQLQLLNKILETKDFSTITTNNLDAKYFFSCQDEFNFIKNHYEIYKAVPDILTFKNSFPNFSVTTVNEPETYLLEQLYNDFNRSYLAQRFNNIKPMLEDGKTEEAMQYFINSVDGLHTGAALTCTDLMQDTSRFDHYMDRTTDHEKYYLTTGFEELDKVIGGIDRENENMVIIARPGVGKTQILLKMAATASQAGLRVGIYEGEMTADKVGYRIDTFLSNISNTSMNRGDIDIKKSYENYIKALSHYNYGPIKVMTLNDIPGGVCTADSIRAFIEKEKLDIVLLDQYDLMDDTSKSSRAEHERIANIAKEIKKLQVEKHIPIISVCQMNRTKNEDGSQDTTQLAGSDKISRYATSIIALEQKQKENKQLELTLNVIKARDGGDHNKLTYTTDFNTGRFIYVEVARNEEQANAIKDSYKVDPADGDMPF